MARGRGRGRGRGRHKGGFREPKKEVEPEYRKSDVYEAEESDPDEVKHAGKRYDTVEGYEYEMPSDFEDEEIDEDEAFNSEDERMYGHLFGNNKRKRGIDDEDESQDEEDDNSEEDIDDSADLLDSSSEDGEEDSQNDEDDGELDDLFNKLNSDSDDDLQDNQDGIQDDDIAHASLLQAVTGHKPSHQQKQQKKKDTVVTEAYPESEFNLSAAGTGTELTLTDLITGLGETKAKLGAAQKTLERMEKKSKPVAAPLPTIIQQRQERKAGYEAAKEEVSKWVPLVKANREAPTLHFKADTSAVPKTVTTASLAAKHTPETTMEMEIASLLEAAGAGSATAVAAAEDALAMKALTVAEAKERREKLAKMRALLFYHEVKAKRLKKIKSKEYRRRLKKSEKRKAMALAENGGDPDLLLDPDALRLELEEAEYQRAKERLTLKHKNTSRFIRRALKRGATLQDEGAREMVGEQLRLGDEIRRRVDKMKAMNGKGDSDEDDDDSSTGMSSDDDTSDVDTNNIHGGTNKRNNNNNNNNNNKGVSAKERAAALDILEGREELETMPGKGLFSLPFMQRTLMRKKAEAEEEARAVLGLDDDNNLGQGNGTDAAGGRRSFGGTVEAARKQAQHVRKMEHAALASESDEDDEREDAEAKAQRLGRVLHAEQFNNTNNDADADNVGGHGAAAIDKKNQDRYEHQDALLEGIHRMQRKSIARKDQLFVDGGEEERQKRKSRTERYEQNTAVSIGPLSKNNTSTSTGVAGKPFISSKKFAGAKAGYVFKKGPSGLGYYADKRQAEIASRDAAKKQRHSEKQKNHGAIAKGRDLTDNNIHNDDDDDNDDNNNNNNISLAQENGDQHMKLLDKKSNARGMNMTQDDLVRMAFAGDDVTTDFANEKQAEVDAELPQEEIPGQLPGWGMWSDDVSNNKRKGKREPKWMVDAKAKAASRREAALAARKDSGLQYVVISEKWDKRNAKYRTPTVPFPFDSKATYENAMRQPLGREFNTEDAFRNLTRPSVMKDAGVIIEPIRFSAAEAEHSAKMDKGAKRAPVITVAGGMQKRPKKRRQ